MQHQDLFSEIWSHPCLETAQCSHLVLSPTPTPVEENSHLNGVVCKETVEITPLTQSGPCLNPHRHILLIHSKCATAPFESVSPVQHPISLTATLRGLWPSAVFFQRKLKGLPLHPSVLERQTVREKREREREKEPETTSLQWETEIMSKTVKRRRESGEKEKDCGRIRER